MTANRNIINNLLLVTLLFVGLSLLATYIRSVGTGIFNADYYYLPLREYVDKSQQREMEELVIDLYNQQQRRGTTVAMIFQAVPIFCLLLVLWKFNHTGVSIAKSEPNKVDITNE